ncbi:ribokinase-like protein [Pontimonas salivibrio]|uniref:Ribokinase-like protein n=1 Tax=Pontimonas salivibrio TaxID=1159327 RepID=A0A2L2BQQ0_9MICO|nr:PfkB family carbohydrate kinase [Pontimonas salivibrio]AVG23978.1 ribokinase-like protein [Pontimonas salivibrio]
MSGHIVSIGEALVDMIEVSDPEHATSGVAPAHTQPHYMAAWGGSPMNVAVGAARLGSRVEFAGSFAADALGGKLKAFLVDQGIGVDLSVDVKEINTTIAMTSFVNAEPQYAFYASPASYGFLPPATANRQQIASAALVHTGSLVVLEDVTYETLTECFRVATGIKTFDPNVRPRMVSNWDDYRRRLGLLINQSDFVKFSLEDIEAAYPNQSADSVAWAALDGPTQAVLVTRGGAPVTLYSHDQQTEIALPGTFPVVDTTGGGDATMAAIVHQLASNGLPGDHDTWQTVVRHALRVAGIVTSRRGGAIAMPSADEVRAAGGAI